MLSFSFSFLFYFVLFKTLATVTETESSATVDGKPCRECFWHILVVPKCCSAVAEASEALREAVQRAVLESLSRGPSQHHPVVDTEIVLESLIREPSATTQGVIVCVTSAVQKLLHNIGTKVRAHIPVPHVIVGPV